jgi:hypothetical protein
MLSVMHCDRAGFATENTVAQYPPRSPRTSLPTRTRRDRPGTCTSSSGTRAMYDEYLNIVKNCFTGLDTSNMSYGENLRIGDLSSNLLSCLLGSIERRQYHATLVHVLAGPRAGHRHRAQPGARQEARLPHNVGSIEVDDHGLLSIIEQFFCFTGKKNVPGP